MDFAKKVPVPAVRDIYELKAVLEDSRFSLNLNDVERAIQSVQAQTGSDRVDVGIKTVLDCIFEARAGGSDVAETFVDKLVEKIQELRG